MPDEWTEKTYSLVAVGLAEGAGNAYRTTTQMPNTISVVVVIRCAAVIVVIAWG